LANIGRNFDIQEESEEICLFEPHRAIIEQKKKGASFYAYSLCLK